MGTRAPGSGGSRRWLLIVVAAIGCAPRPAARTATATFAPRRAPIAIPPRPGDGAALDRAAAGERALALVDLFDAARLAADGAARALLAQQLEIEGGAAAARGAAATREVIARLTTRAEAAGERALATLLEDDAEELAGGDAATIAAHRREVARGADAAAAHALLSLYATCANALVDAANAPQWRRAVIANHCLFPLLDDDAEPWFRPDPAARPPDPPWSEYLARLPALLAAARARAPHLAGLTTGLGQQLERFAEALRRDGVEPPDVARVAAALPVGDEDLPAYDREPWALVAGGMVVIGQARFHPRDHELSRRIEQVLGSARLGSVPARLAILAPADSGADVVDSLVAIARRGGAESVALVLAAPLPATPAGEARGLGAPPRHRLVVLPLQLRAASGRDLPRQLDGRPPTVTLLPAPEGVTALAQDGALALGPAADSGPRIESLRRAFPDESQIALAIDPTATYHDLLAVARAARASFHRVTLVEVPNRPREAGFAARVRRREAARMVLRDDDPLLARRARRLRGCYLEVLDRLPELALAVTFQPGSPIGVEAPERTDPAFVECLRDRSRGLDVRREFTVSFAPR